MNCGHRQKNISAARYVLGDGQTETTSVSVCELSSVSDKKADHHHQNLCLFRPKRQHAGILTGNHCGRNWALLSNLKFNCYSKTSEIALEATKMKRILGLFLASSVVTQVRGFVPSLATVSCNAVPRIRQNPTKTQNRVRSLPLDRPGRDLGRPTSALAAGGPADGSDRGNVILGLVFLICVWIFSIPPELRRTHICTSDACVGKFPVPHKSLACPRRWPGWSSLTSPLVFVGTNVDDTNHRIPFIMLRLCNIWRVDTKCQGLLSKWWSELPRGRRLA